MANKWPEGILKGSVKMSENLLIIFVKNMILGKVKTRLAHVIGKEGAYQIYGELVKITERETQKVNSDRRIYYSDTIANSKWENDQKFIQKGIDLGERMKHAFEEGFIEGYQNIIVIGSDLPSIDQEIIEKGFQKLRNNDVVFGPAEDGGYYLLGMSKMIPSVFENKPWSQSNLLTLTLEELSEQGAAFDILETMNDIDTYEDLIKSNFYQKNKVAQEIITNLQTSK
jgi:rSAM/selenodomain-associated transferase 1